MDNLTQTQSNLKQTCLDEHRSKMLICFQIAGQDERKAIFKHIDAILPGCMENERIFWLKFRNQLERLSEVSK